MNTQDKTQNLITIESNRYKNKGFGIVFAIVIFISYFTLLPSLGKIIFPKKIENPGKFYVLSTLFTHELSFILINSCMFIIYKLKSPFFERYKTTLNKWPWEEDYSQWEALLKKTLKLLIFNHFLILPMVLLMFYIKDVCPMRTDYESLPDYIEVTLHILFFILCEDFGFYFSHRLLHHKYLYSHIHKVHHTYRQVVSISSEYAHPIEFIVSNLFTTSLGSIILGKNTHLYTYLLWIIIRVGESCDGHCGYEFSWSPYRLLFLSAGEDFHNYHHLFFKDNYGSFFTFWDRVMGTVNERYKEYVNSSKIIKIS